MGVQIRDLSFHLSSFSFATTSFEFEERGLYLIRGRNGCGKTSLLRCLLGRIRKDKGEIKGLQFPIGTCGIESLFIGSWTLDENFKWLSALGKFVAPSPKISGVSSNQRFDRLSLGQRRQAELQFVLNPALKTLFLDEPFTHLDQENIRSFASEIQQAGERSLVLMTSHQEVESLKFTKVFDL